jgi:hypothetical protein
MGKYVRQKDSKLENSFKISSIQNEYTTTIPNLIAVNFIQLTYIQILFIVGTPKISHVSHQLETSLEKHPTFTNMCIHNS